MDYVTKSEIEQYLGLQIDDTLTAYLETLATAAKEYIFNYTGREFDAADTDSTRYFDGNDGKRLKIDDIRSITSLTVRGSLNTDLVLNTDYFLYPLNAPAKGLPYTHIELIQPETRLDRNSRLVNFSPYIFNKGQRTVVVVGKFGYSAAGEEPADIKLAALKLIGGVIKENIGDTDLKELTQESLGEYSASYAKLKDVANALGINDILDKYVCDDTPKSGTFKI